MRSDVQGTQATLSHCGIAPNKVRAVLGLIRGLGIDEARDVLQFCERGAAEEIGKLLNSAIANAEHNDHLDPEELFVSACWADEGPTAKRWRPRARGRATKIRKRTSHITIVVDRMPDEALELHRARSERRGGGGATQANRARRRAASRAAEAQAEHNHDHDHDHDHGSDHDNDNDHSEPEEAPVAESAESEVEETTEASE